LLNLNSIENSLAIVALRDRRGKTVLRRNLHVGAR
jgi:hypothetical protein